MLWSHKGFSLEAAFDHLDTNKSNTINAEEFAAAFKEADLPLDGGLPDKFIMMWDDD